MQQDHQSVVDAYDRHYAVANHFAHREWVYLPYMRALVQKAKLSPGASVLDAGCGQGFFTWLFARLGFDAVGVDISEQGIISARAHYGASGARYLLGDVRNLGTGNQFDCVFTRSCSLYNEERFRNLTEVTDCLLEYVKPGGIFIFDYNTHLTARRNVVSWIDHSLEDVRSHFAVYQHVQTYFSLRLDSLLLGSVAFSETVSRIDATVSKWTGIGGELIAIVAKHE
jgi:SAM-dependent methyltransferase